MTTGVNGARDGMTLMLDERRLNRQEVVRLTDMHSGDAIICTCGILWVTEEDDLEDYVLQKGGVFVAKCDGVVVIQALTKAAYRLSSKYKMYDWMSLDLEGKSFNTDSRR